MKNLRSKTRRLPAAAAGGVVPACTVWRVMCPAAPRVLVLSLLHVAQLLHARRCLLRPSDVTCPLDAAQGSAFRVREGGGLWPCYSRPSAVLWIMGTVKRKFILVTAKEVCV